MATMPHKVDVASNDHTSSITNTTTTTTTHHTIADKTTNDSDNSAAPTKPKATTTPSTTTATTPTTTQTHRPNITTTNNNNNNTAPPKRTTIPLADGWTLVSTTKSQQHRLRKNNNKKNKKGSSMQTGGGGGGYSGLASPASLRAAHEPAGPAKLMPGASKEWLLERLGKFRERWGECACRRGIGEVLGRAGVAGAESESESSVDDDEGEEGGEEKKDNNKKNRVVIRNAVCVGLGSLSVDNVAAGVRSMWQLVCFLDMVGMLSGGGAGGPVKMYAEDPVFNALDVEVFEELGITVVHGLRSTDGSRQEGAAQFIEPDSFVFAPFMPSFIVLEDFLADRDPAIYVGNDVLATLELARSQVRYSGDVDERTRRCIRVADEFLAQGREVVTLPEFELHEHALAGQMIYWRKPAEES
ncbi:hypothetical protein SLS54_002183 [Diplodia seriata]